MITPATVSAEMYPVGIGIAGYASRATLRAGIASRVGPCPGIENETRRGAGAASLRIAYAGGIFGKVNLCVTLACPAGLTVMSGLSMVSASVVPLHRDIQVMGVVDTSKVICAVWVTAPTPATVAPGT